MALAVPISIASPARGRDPRHSISSIKAASLRIESAGLGDRGAPYLARMKAGDGLPDPRPPILQQRQGNRAPEDRALIARCHEAERASPALHRHEMRAGSKRRLTCWQLQPDKLAPAGAFRLWREQPPLAEIFVATARKSVV